MYTYKTKAAALKKAAALNEKPTKARWWVVQSVWKHFREKTARFAVVSRDAGKTPTTVINFGSPPIIVKAPIL